MNDVEKDRNRKCAVKVLEEFCYDIDEESFDPDFPFITADLLDPNLKGIMKIRVKCDSPFLRFEKLTKAPEVSEEETQHLLGILVR